MSCLDKGFVYFAINKPPKITRHDDYIKYLKNDAINLLGDNATLLSHIIESCGSDTTAFLLYIYKGKYVFFEILMGTCSHRMPKYQNNYDEIVLNAIEKCYITDSKIDMETYYKKRIANIDYESEYIHNIYCIHPEEAFDYSYRK